jgi:hypothetical protein
LSIYDPDHDWKSKEKKEVVCSSITGMGYPGGCQPSAKIWQAKPIAANIKNKETICLFITD